MQKLKVFGLNKLKGKIIISGSKNASLPILAATLLTNKKVYLKNLPKVKDIETMIKLLQSLGSKIKFENRRLVIDGGSDGLVYRNNLIDKTNHNMFTQSIYIIARNKYGYSEPSNKLKIVPKSTNLNNAEFDTKTNKYVESKPTVKNIDSKFSFEYDNSGMITDVNQTSYDDTDYINMFSKLINEKNISSKIKTNYNFELI